MLKVARRLISYTCVISGKNIKHYILIGNSQGRRFLLSHANLYLRDATASSTDTSNRYSNLISMFYRYLSATEKYSAIDVSQYHSLVNNEDIKNWQIKQQVDRSAKQAERPSSETILEGAKVVFGFFYWLHTEGYESCVNFKLKTWQPNFKDDQLLNYIKREAKVGLDSKSIKALDNEFRSQRAYSLITNQEIEDLITNYVDPVYAVMFNLALGTAMRPMDLCEFPYVGNGLNSHIQPYDNMSFNDATVEYGIAYSKGKKYRNIRIHRDDLKSLFDHYTNKLYPARAELYAKRFSKPCPPSILFLNYKGIPVTPKMIGVRSNAAKKRAFAHGSTMRKSVCFYDSRHWWPTMFLIKRFGSGLLGELSEVKDLAAMQVLKNQMGHSHLITTYEHYVDAARILLLAHQGFVNDLMVNADQTVGQFLKMPVFD